MAAQSPPRSPRENAESGGASDSDSDSVIPHHAVRRVRAAVIAAGGRASIWASSSSSRSSRSSDSDTGNGPVTEAALTLLAARAAGTLMAARGLPSSAEVDKAAARLLRVIINRPYPPEGTWSLPLRHWDHGYHPDFWTAVCQRTLALLRGQRALDGWSFTLTVAMGPEQTCRPTSPCDDRGNCMPLFTGHVERLPPPPAYIHTASAGPGATTDAATEAATTTTTEPGALLAPD
jgi:hypothetical protein